MDLWCVCGTYTLNLKVRAVKLLPVLSLEYVLCFLPRDHTLMLSYTLKSVRSGINV